MNQPDASAVTNEADQPLADLALQANTRLEEAAKQSSDQAFNLGCSIAAIPALILVGLVFIVTGANWAAAMIAAILALVITLVLSLAAANRAKTNTLRRRFDEQVEPEIGATLVRLDRRQEEFNRQAGRVLPSEAALRRFLDIPIEPDEESPSVPQE